MSDSLFPIFGNMNGVLNAYILGSQREKNNIIIVVLDMQYMAWLHDDA
jgi:hypothetical protein